MSKFFVTNNKSWYQKLKDNICNSLFKIYGDYADDGIFAISTQKLQIDNINFLQNGHDFIIQTGTCVYKEKSGKDALNNALIDFLGDVQTHRESYMGNWGCFIKKGSSMVAFNEGAGFYNIFYYQKNGKWLVGTNLIDIARLVSDSITINKLNVLEKLTRYAIFDNDTYFNEVKRLSGDQYLKLTRDNLALGDLDLEIAQENPTDYDKRAKDIAREMKYIASVMYKNFSQPTIGCTGGFDSRMTLAAYLAAGIKPKIAYGYGSSSLAPSMKGDVDVNNVFSKRYGLDFNLVPWNETEPIDKLWDEYIENYGELMYDGCEDAYKFHTNPKEKFLSFGYIGEIYREADWSKNIAKDKITLNDYLWGNHAICNRNIIEKNTHLVYHWLQKWEKLNKKHGINNTHFEKRDLFWLLLAYRSSADNHMVNIVNQFKYAHYLMSDMRILRNGYVDFEKKYNGCYMLQILKEVYPDILNVPFFTHCQHMHFNPHKMQLEKTRRDSFRTKITGIIPNDIKKIIKKILMQKNAKPQYINGAYSLLEKDNNEEKLLRLVGKDVLESIELNNYNLTFIIRGIILCKTFDFIGIKY